MSKIFVPDSGENSKMAVRQEHDYAHGRASEGPIQHRNPDPPCPSVVEANLDCREELVISHKAMTPITIEESDGEEETEDEYDGESEGEGSNYQTQDSVGTGSQESQASGYTIFTPSQRHQMCRC